MMLTLTDTGQLQTVLDVEVALAEAEAEAGVIPSSCVPHIRAAARVELYDVAAIVADAAQAGNIAIPLIERFTARVAVLDADSAGYVHKGATSQDVIDTALVLQLREAIPVVLRHLDRAMVAAADHARRHIDSPMPGRTWLQQATPTTFGLKAAGWLDIVARSRARLTDTLDRALVLQLGGASGTLASLGNDGPVVAEALGRRLGLQVPDIPWHTHRDRLADLACALGVTCGSLGKIGRDLALLAQTEVGEAFEPSAPGRGGSSSMPHKRNPVFAVVAIAASVRAPGLVSTMLAAMPQEHERGIGGWQSEWQTLPALVDVTTGAAEAIATALTGLTIDVSRMRENLDLRGGVALAESLSAALATHIGRSEAMKCVERACRRAERDRRPVREVAAEDPAIGAHVSSADIARLLSTDHAVGSARVFVERVLRRWAR